MGVHRKQRSGSSGKFQIGRNQPWSGTISRESALELEVEA